MQQRIRAVMFSLAAAGLAALLAACGSASSATPAAASSSTSKAPGNRGDRGVTGQISAENGSTWTLTTKDGKQVTVDVTPQTQYGTKQEPADAKQFPVGTTVRVSGTRTGDKITAERIAKPPAKKSTSPAPTSSASNG
jgi:ABC-type Fe3+-hydroxamate transport system substrate-binding protein